MEPNEQPREAIHQRAGHGEEILRIENLVKYFPIRAGILKRTVGQIHAVDGVDLSIQAGETRRAGRRVGLRQDDPVTHDHQADRADQREHLLQRA